MSAVHVLVPDGVDDPQMPSGGNVYDREISRGLAALGWCVSQRAVVGTWPEADADARDALAAVLAGLADDSVVLVDGLVASTVPDLLEQAAARLRLVVLMHMPLDCEAERSGLAAAAAVVTTSSWTRRRLLDRYALSPHRVHVAEPGTEQADLADGTVSGSELLCVAAVTHGKGHAVLLAALALLSDLTWRLTCVGSTDGDPDLALRLDRQAHADGIGDRVRFVGTRVGSNLDAEYAAADVLVLASRAETFAMVVTEALARGLPVVATAVGGVPEALGHGLDGSLPGMLVPADDPSALAAALRRWLSEPGVRRRLRLSARARRTTLTGWHTTSLQVSQVLAEVTR